MQHPITIMGSTALSPRSPKKVTFASRTNPANHAAKVKTVAQPYPIITRPFITIRLACSLVWVYHTAWQKTTAICQNSPFSRVRTDGHTQRLTRNAQYRGMQSKRQDTTVMVILCLCSFTALRTLSAEPPINKKRTRTLFHKESGSSTNCMVEN